ncbi:MAG: hypothetical protein JJV93_02460 [Alphaproteobacteria bacterium]|nr:hypothetical protein [Alphaproteobacteria bacterium]
MSKERSRKNIIVLHKEIDLIQNCITRLNHNSFIIKGWAIAVLVTCIYLSRIISLELSLFILSVILIMFWCLDGFFLQTETKYRKMYNDIIDNKSDENLYDLNPNRYKVKCIISFIFSKTLVPLYLTLIILSILGSLYLHYTTPVKQEQHTITKGVYNG